MLVGPSCKRFCEFLRQLNIISLPACGTIPPWFKSPRGWFFPWLLLTSCHFLCQSRAWNCYVQAWIEHFLSISVQTNMSITCMQKCMDINYAQVQSFNEHRKSNPNVSWFNHRFGLFKASESLLKTNLCRWNMSKHVNTTILIKPFWLIQSISIHAYAAWNSPWDLGIPSKEGRPVSRGDLRSKMRCSPSAPAEWFGYPETSTPKIRAPPICFKSIFLHFSGMVRHRVWQETKTALFLKWHCDNWF